METGSQLTLYANLSQRKGSRTAIEWILDVAKETGVHGATVVECSEGVDMHGRTHAAHFFELADEPAIVIFVASDPAIDTLLGKLAQGGVTLFYTRSRVEFGHLGEAR